MTSGRRKGRGEATVKTDAFFIWETTDKDGR